MKQEVKTAQTDYTVLVFIPDSASTDGSGKTGLVAANLTVSGVRVETDNDVTVTDYTSSLNDLAALTTAHTDWGLLEVSNTLAPGLYRLDIADAMFASGAWSAVVYVMVTTSAAAASPMEFILVPDAPITGVNVSQFGGTAGTFSGGIPESKVASIAADAITATAIAADAITAAKIADGAIDAATFAAGAINAAAIAADAITDAKVASDVTIASVTGAVGSVTGAVGSVTGAVGSVTGAVGSVAAGGITAASFGANAISAAKLDPDVTTELQAGLATQTSVDDLPTNAELTTALGTADDAVLVQVALVKIQTDKLTFDGDNHVAADARKLSASAAAADRLEAGATGLVVSTCAAGSTTTNVITNLTEATNDHYNGRVITFTSGALLGQSTNITDYNGTTKALTVTALTEAAADTDAFVIS